MNSRLSGKQTSWRRLLPKLFDITMKLLQALLLLLMPVIATAADDIAVKDYDISMSQEDCRLTAIRTLQSLASGDVPVMELQHIISYQGSNSELVAVCRADKGLLVLFARGELTQAAHIRFHQAFTP